MRIALYGGMRCGKDTIADYLVKNYGFYKCGFGDALKHYYHSIFGHTTDGKDREGYQWFGQTMRKRDPDIWVKKLDEKLKPLYLSNSDIVVKDLRQPNEYDYLTKKGFFVVKVEASIETQLQRIREKGDVFREELLEHETEKHFNMFIPHETIRNEGSLEELYKQVEELLQKIKKEA